MQRKRELVRGVLSLGTLIRISLVSGFAIGLMFGVFAGVVSFMASGSVTNLILLAVLVPPATALVLTMITLIGHPLYAALNRAGFPGLDKIGYDVDRD